MIKLKYNGHANISLTKDNVTILIDPFFTDNPVNKWSRMWLYISITCPLWPYRRCYRNI